MRDSATKVQSPTARLGKAKAGSGAVLLAFGGLVAAFGASACCGLPLTLAALGLGSAWLFGPASLAAPYQTILLAVAPILLGGGGLLLWRQHGNVCPLNAICARPAVRIATLVCLLLGTALVYLGYAYIDA